MSKRPPTRAASTVKRPPTRAASTVKASQEESLKLDPGTAPPVPTAFALPEPDARTSPP